MPILSGSNKIMLSLGFFLLRNRKKNINLSEYLLTKKWEIEVCQSLEWCPIFPEMEEAEAQRPSLEEDAGPREP